MTRGAFLHEGAVCQAQASSLQEARSQLWSSVQSPHPRNEGLDLTNDILFSQGPILYTQK